MPPNNDFFVSVLATVPEDETALPEFVRQVSAVLASHYGNHEIVLVEAHGRTAFSPIIQELARRHENLRFLRLSRRTDRPDAINSGLTRVIGDCVVVMSVTEDPPAILPAVIAKHRAEALTVFGRRADRLGQNPLSRLGSSIFHWYCRRVLGIAFPDNATGLAVLGRKELNALLKIRDSRRRLELLSLYTGYPFTTVTYSPQGSRDTLKTAAARLKLAYDVTVASSLHPLRVVSLLALAISFLNLVYITYALGIFLFDPNYSQGWPSLSIQMSVMFFFVFLILYVIAEYIGRMVSVTLDWPKTFVAEEKNSSVVIEDERVNVVK